MKMRPSGAKSIAHGVSRRAARVSIVTFGRVSAGWPWEGRQATRTKLRSNRPVLTRAKNPIVDRAAAQPPCAALVMAADAFSQTGRRSAE